MDDSSHIPLARLAAQPPPLSSSLSYSHLPDAPPRASGRVGLFLLGMLGSCGTLALAFVVLVNLGPGISIASVMARLVAVGIALSPFAIDRAIARRLRTHAYLFGAIPSLTLLPMFVYNAIVM